MSEEDLPPGWAIYEDDEGQIFYGNESTGETSTTFPRKAAIPPPPSRTVSPPKPTTPVRTPEPMTNVLKSGAGGRPPPPQRDNLSQSNKPNDVEPDVDFDYALYPGEAVPTPSSNFGSINPLIKNKSASEKSRSKSPPPTKPQSSNISSPPSLPPVIPPTSPSSSPTPISPLSNVELSPSRELSRENSQRPVKPIRHEKHLDNNIDSYQYEFDDDENETYEESARQNKDPNNLPSPPGLSRTTRHRVEVPREYLDRVLLAGEEVLPGGQFDVFYPEKRPSPLSRLLLTIFTFGLYIIYRKFIKPCILYIRKTFFCIQCAPGIAYLRGKMAVTSAGRVLYWKLDVKQTRRIFDGSSMDYVIHHHARILSLADLRQITLHYSDTANGLFAPSACLRSYNAGIDLSFHSFDYSPMHPQSENISALPSSNFFSSLTRYLGVTQIDSSSKQYQSVVIRVVSEASNQVYENNEGFEPLSSLHVLNEKLLTVLSLSLPENAFMPASAAESSELRRLSGHNDSNGLDKPIEFLDDFFGYEPVTKDGEIVSISTKWVPLFPGESVVARYGISPKFTCLDYLLSAISFGVYYYMSALPRFRRHTAFILTTKRLIEVYLQEPQGKVPTNLSNFTITIRSYFPKNIHSGYIRYIHGAKMIESQLYTSGGALSVHLPYDALAFIQRMHITVTRGGDERSPIQPLISSIEQLTQKLPTKFQSIVRDIPLHVPTEQQDVEVGLGEGLTPLTQGILRPIDERIAPFFNSEVPLYRLQGGFQHTACCYGSFGMPSSKTHEDDSSMSLRWKSFLSNIIRTCTCGMRPFGINPALLITSHSLMYIDVKSNSARCCQFNPGTNPPPFLVVWTPIRSLQSQQIDIYTEGNFRIDKLCGLCLCPARARRSEYAFGVQTSTGVTYRFRGEAANSEHGGITRARANWLRDGELQRAQSVLGALQQAKNGEIPKYS